MVDRCVSAKLVFVLFIVSFSSVAAAQTKPRFVIAIDTSGSMRENFSGTNTNGDGVGRVAVPATDSAALTKDGVYYGCNAPRAGSGDDTNADCLPNDSKIWQAKDAVTKMVNGFGDVEWALSRFKQTQALNASQPNNPVTSACGGAQGTCTGNYFINYA